MFETTQFDEKFRQRDHELRVQSVSESDLFWQLGVRWQNSDLDSANGTFAAYSSQSRGVLFEESGDRFSACAASRIRSA